jgi:bifunctional non-homologous end joining protein LigD
MKNRPPEDVTVSRPDKILWPELQISKQLYVDYLSAVSEHMLPWLQSRPLTLVRAPDGVEGEQYFQKSAPTYAPDWIATVEVPAPSAGRDVRYVVCNDAATLAWLGNQAVLEFHPAPVRVDKLDRPDLFFVDVDPPDGEFDAAVEATLLVLEVVADLGWEAGVKTTGGKGLHIVVPLERRYTATHLRKAAAMLTDLVSARRPGLVTDAFRKTKRQGRVMLDPSRNGTGATVVAPFSPRARKEGTVSFPVSPETLGDIKPEDFTLATVPAMLNTAGVREWHALAERRFRIPSALRRR